MPEDVVRVLLVEDEPTLGPQLTAELEKAGFKVELATDGEQGSRLGASRQYSVIVLDLGLPKLDGLTALERWRKDLIATPVLILTARDSWSDKVAGLDAGADDYLTKPFEPAELLSRVRALIRRTEATGTTVFSVGEVLLDQRSGRVTVRGQPVKLTAQEYKLLLYLMGKKGTVATRGELIEHIYDQDFDRDSNTVEVFITRLRKKLGTDIIMTWRGVGYSVEDPS